MTAREAYSILKPPLRFGDESQIQAHKWLELFVDCRERIRDCRSEHGEAAEYRDRNEVLQEVLICHAFEGFDQEILKEAALCFIRECRGQ